ncbi:hypothetical protein GCM10009767_03160 [Kocuria aegyptia]|uniref:Uncharacterized protein n=1 Tax=Kocuria aegyptia TaxID=330943 RepID=A0ABN2K3P0_9MICC
MGSGTKAAGVDITGQLYGPPAAPVPSAAVRPRERSGTGAGAAGTGTRAAPCGHGAARTHRVHPGPGSRGDRVCTPCAAPPHGHGLSGCSWPISSSWTAAPERSASSSFTTAKARPGG